jgi:hypothetical protein
VGAEGAQTVPIDWMGGTIVDDASDRARASTQAVGIPTPFQQALKDLTALGLSRENLWKCKSCSRWFLRPSRKAQVCPKCRPRIWPTKVKQRRRAEISQELAEARALRRSR